LADLLNGFASRWRTSRPATAGRFAPSRQRTEVPFMGPVDWLVQETRHADPDMVGVSPGTIERIMGKRSKTTELRTADALVSAIGCPEAWHDGTLEIQPNPCASPREQAACCGASAATLTGALSPDFWSQLSACVRT
jgi:hypothetical protein